MRDFDEYRAYTVLAKVLEIDEISLLDRMVLSAEHDRNNIAFSVHDHQILQTWDFFEARKYEFYFVQNGEFLTLEHINKNEIFIAYEKQSSGFSHSTGRNFHHIYAYRPEG